MTEKAAPWPRMGVFKLPPETAGIGAGWMVPSASVDGAFRLVLWHSVNGRVHLTCSCPHGVALGAQRDRTCRHVTAVAAAEKADGLAPRPTAPPNIAALTD